MTDNGSPACTDSEVVVTVQEVGGENQCPVLGPIGDRTVNESVLLTFTATATDTDIGQTLTYSLSTNAPTGATLDPSTGLFNWTPTEDQSPGVYPITIRVFDTGEPRARTRDHQRHRERGRGQHLSRACPDRTGAWTSCRS